MPEIVKFATTNDTKNLSDRKTPKFSQRDHNGKMTGLVIKGACLNIYFFCWQAKDVYSVTLFVLSSQCGLNSSSDGRTGSAFTQKAFLQRKPNSPIKS